MSKYNAGDKVVLRKDLEVDKIYGGFYWAKVMNTLSDKSYVTIEGDDFLGSYKIVELKRYRITEEMITGLYEK